MKKIQATNHCVFCGADVAKAKPFVNNRERGCCDACLKGLYSGSLMTTVTTYKREIGLPIYYSHDVCFIPAGALVVGCEEEL